MKPASDFSLSMALGRFTLAPTPTPTPPHQLSNQDCVGLRPTANGLRCRVTTDNEDGSIGLLRRQRRGGEV